jgi:NADH:ubiquinone oxidoreductase subunit 5 (subunit L)/multisubunit Na+/H+ antiporter MnhA subunit
LLLVHSLTKPALFLVAGRSGLQTSAWIYFTGAIVLSSGMYGQNAILAPGLSGGLKPVVAALALSSMFIESAVLFRVGFRLLPRIGRRGDSRDSGERGVASQGRTWPMWLPVVVAIILGPMLSGWTFGNVGTGGVSLDTMLRETGVFSDDTTSGDTPFFSVGVTLPISLLGMVVAWMMQATSAKLPASANVMLATVVRLGENGFYLRDCFRLGFSIPVRLLARFCLFVETTVVGGVGRAVFWGIPVVVGRAAGLLQNGVVQFYALAMTLTLAVLLFALCWLKV